MSLITYKDIVVSGIKNLHILELKIYQKICEHATAQLKIMVEREDGLAYIEQSTEKDLVKIEIRGEVVYVGTISKMQLSHIEEGSILGLELISTSKLLDCTYRSRSFQRVGIFYADLMQHAIGANGSIVPNFSDDSTKGIIIQYQETDWEFVRRLALKCEAVISPDMKSEQAVVYVGIAPNSGGFIEQVGSVQDSELIIEVESELVRGELVSKVRTAQKEQVPRHIPSDYIVNPVVGKIFPGVVKAVSMDQIQAHIIDIDDEYEAGNWWFPYSTIYSSPQNDAGIYAMPMIEEKVRLFFPSEDPAEAFAAGSNNHRELGKTSKEKIFTSPEGMGVKFYEGGLMLYNKDKKIYIDLKSDGEVELHSKQNIEIIAKENMFLAAGEKLHIASEKEVFLGTAQSFIDLNASNGGTIDMYSSKIFVQ